MVDALVFTISEPDTKEGMSVANREDANQRSHMPEIHKAG